MYTKLIYDEKEVQKFFDLVLPPLLPTECYFLSLSARNKYLTMEEREYYSLGRTEMFSKTIVRERDWNRFLRTLRKFECDERGYTTKTNIPIPSKTMVCYININPSDTIKALTKFTALINEYFSEACSIAINTRDASNFANRLNKVDNNLMTYYQQATGTKHWLDFDFDVPKDTRIISITKDILKNSGITNFFWIDTKSGYHLLLDKKQLRFNPHDFCSDIDDLLWDAEILTDDNYEIIHNSNAMIPLPGTLQGGYEVKLINP